MMYLNLIQEGYDYKTIQSLTVTYDVFKWKGWLLFNKRKRCLTVTYDVFK